MQGNPRSGSSGNRGFTGAVDTMSEGFSSGAQFTPPSPGADQRSRSVADAQALFASFSTAVDELGKLKHLFN
ncbi:unnamed protein product [Linum trigynum]